MLGTRYPQRDQQPREPSSLTPCNSGLKGLLGHETYSAEASPTPFESNNKYPNAEHLRVGASILQ